MFSYKFTFIRVKNLQTVQTMEQDLRLGTVPLFFPWTKVNEESLCREKKTENFQNDSVVVSLPTLGKWVEEIKVEIERFLHDESQECKAREKISLFGLERFSSSNEDI